MTSKFKFDLAGRLAGHRAGQRIGLLAAVAALSALAVTGCSTYNNATQMIAQHITPYRVTVVQGNFVSSEAAAKLHLGLTRNEVRSVLGTPLLTDMFHNDRWDYLFYFKRGATEVVQQRELTVYFEGDHLVRWTGAENLPSELELLAEIDGDKRSQKSLAAERKAKAAAAASAASAVTAASAATASGAAVSTPIPDSSNSTSGSFGLRSPAAPIGASAVSTDHTSQQFALPTQAPLNAPTGGLSN